MDSDPEFDFFDLRSTLAVFAAAGALIGDAPQPVRDSELTGHAYVQEVLKGHPTRFLELMRMPKETFLALRDLTIERGLLEDTKKGFTVEEQLAIFLFTVGHGASNK
jgi:hypothetical protein